MPNTILERPLDAVNAELLKMGVVPNGALWTLIRDLAVRADKTTTNNGEIQSKANVTGRTEQLSSTLQNVTSAGQLSSTDAIAADGTGSPLTGGRRGFVALDTNNRLANSFRANALNVAKCPTSSTALSNDGVSHTITIAATTMQYGTSTISYNSGSVDPGAFGSFFIFADDPTFAGGAVTYQFSSTPQDQTAGDGRVNFGKITTAGGTAHTGGGNTGGDTPGGEGGFGFNQG